LLVWPARAGVLANGWPRERARGGRGAA